MQRLKQENAAATCECANLRKRSAYVIKWQSRSLLPIPSSMLCSHLLVARGFRRKLRGGNGAVGAAQRRVEAAARSRRRRVWSPLRGERRSDLSCGGV